VSTPLCTGLPAGVIAWAKRIQPGVAALAPVPSQGAVVAVGTFAGRQAFGNDTDLDIRNSTYTGAFNNNGFAIKLTSNGTARQFPQRWHPASELNMVHPGAIEWLKIFEGSNGISNVAESEFDGSVQAAFATRLTSTSCMIKFVSVLAAGWHLHSWSLCGQFSKRNGFRPYRPIFGRYVCGQDEYCRYVVPLVHVVSLRMHASRRRRSGLVCRQIHR